MKKQYWILLLPLLILSAVLAGCSPGAGAEQQVLKPLDNAAWPTPVPAEVRPSPTPFPKVLANQVRVLDDAVPTATPAVSDAPAAASDQPSAVSDQAAAAGEKPAAASDQPSATLAPALRSGPFGSAGVAAQVRGPKGVNLRQGPGTSYPIVATLRAGEAVKVLGVNEGARDWAFVETGAGKRGWASLPLLEPAAPLTDVPVQPAPAASSGQPSAVSDQQSAVSRQPSAAGGLIVFQRASGSDIMVINPDGSGLRRLTNGIDPVLSPDGRQVAFTRSNGDDGSLWVIGLDGSNERQVAGGIKQGKHPTWSPDGQRVAVNLQHGGRLDPARPCANLAQLGGEMPDIPFNVIQDSIKVEVKGQYPYLIPYLCWTVPPDLHWSVRIVDLATGSTSDELTDNYAYGPEWDPANPWRIISSGWKGLMQMDINRQALWALTDRHEDHTPVFSPDGKYIAVAYNSGGRYDIHRLDAGGGNRVALTKPPLWLVAEDKKPWNNLAPAWSPDGKQIAFLTDRTGRWEIWVMNADGSDQRPMFSQAVMDQLQLKYDFVDERMLSWGA